VVDPEGLLLVEAPGEPGVELPRRLEALAERLLEGQPAAGSEPGPGEPVDGKRPGGRAR
jgi:hypothetical protein